MSEQKIRRKYKPLSVTLTTSTASATTIRWDDVAGGALHMGTVNTNASSIQVWGATSTDSTLWGRVYDSSGSAADITLSASSTQGRVYAMPDAAYGCGAIKLVAGATNATAATCVVMLKT
jgi:hypothetical protein